MNAAVAVAFGLESTLISTLNLPNTFHSTKTLFFCYLKSQSHGSNDSKKPMSTNEICKGFDLKLIKYKSWLGSMLVLGSVTVSVQSFTLSER